MTIQLRGSVGKSKKALFLDLVAKMVEKEDRWISVYELKELANKWCNGLHEPLYGLVKRLKVFNLIWVNGSEVIPDHERILPPDETSIIVVPSDPFNHRNWTTCQMGPCDAKESERFEERIREKGWEKVKRLPVLQAQYRRLDTKRGTFFFWAEPCDAGGNWKAVLWQFTSGDEVDRSPEREEELNERRENGDKVGATVLKILQRSTEGPATGNKEAMG